ncbi:hypothetical protein VL10_09355 [Leclercia adecarboxylata]|nr:hypothetical protein VL10_09355 [Leclercia adecarboxylata]KMN61784.1 hypothetical protein VK95_23025 [Leclercia sp. LK8]
MARQEQWEAFFDSCEQYITELHELIRNQVGELTQEEKTDLSPFLTNLIANENKIITLLKARLDTLSQNITLLDRGKKCTQAYSSQFAAGLQ